MKDFGDEGQRRRAIAWAVALTADTHLVPGQYESTLLESYAQGGLTLEEVLLQLDSRVQHILYCSRAVHPLDSSALTDLLEQSRAYNAGHHITGLLCYSYHGGVGHFVQVLEGSAQEVHTLFAKIRHDRRHYHVELLSNKAGAERLFADWQMAFVEADAAEFFWLIGYLQAKGHNLIVPKIPITEAHLLTLLERFSHV